MVGDPSQLTHAPAATDALDAPVAPVVFHDHDVSSRGVRQRRFDVVHGGRTVPGMLWTPEDAASPSPLVLVGHGVTHSKSESYVVALARTLARHHGIAAVAVDGPGHGDRRPDGSADPALVFAEFSQAWAAGPTVVDDMVQDWRAVRGAVQALDEVSGGPVGYWGLSMGTILGVSVVAAEPAVAVAVLGLWGVAGPGSERLATDAAAISCPVMFLVQWDDELCPRRYQFELFDALGTADKRLHANPGAHSAVPAEQFLASARFLADHLVPA